MHHPDKVDGFSLNRVSPLVEPKDAIFNKILLLTWPKRLCQVDSCKSLVALRAVVVLGM